MMMAFTRIFLALMALTWGGSGLNALHDPVSFISTSGIGVVGDDAVFEMRAIYGGIGVGAALVFLLAVIKPRFNSAALFCIAAFGGGHVIGRIVGFIYDGWPVSPTYPYLIAYEVTITLIAMLLLIFIERNSQVNHG